MNGDFTPVQRSLNGFQIDGYNPFMTATGTTETLLTEAHGLLKVIGTAFNDSATAENRGIDAELPQLNKAFVSSALQGIGSLIALAMLMQEHKS
ncbi:hypothetical protein [Sphingomonas sp. UYP23]